MHVSREDREYIFKRVVRFKRALSLLFSVPTTAKGPEANESSM